MTPITLEEACWALAAGKWLYAPREGMTFRASGTIKEGRSFDELELLTSNGWLPIDVDSKNAIKHRMESGYRFEIVEPKDSSK